MYENVRCSRRLGVAVVLVLGLTSAVTCVRLWLEPVIERRQAAKRDDESRQDRRRRRRRADGRPGGRQACGHLD